MKRFLIGLCAVLSVMASSCKKEKPANTTTVDTAKVVTTPVTPPPTTGTTLDLMRDSVYLYAKEDYYWSDGLPDYTTFAPRNYTGSTDLAALQKEVNALSQYKINPATGQAYEYSTTSPGSAKYSFIDDGTTSQRLSAVTGDFGFSLGYNNSKDLRVAYVYAGSPAANAGIKRSDQIISINGHTDLSATTANVNFIVNAYANSSSIAMTLQRTDSTTYSVNMNTAVYKINPVITYKTIAITGGNAGYIVFNSYVALSSAQAALTTAFNSFAANGIKDLIVDLRYNGGGYVETAQYLDNLIVPASASGKTMYTAYYNPLLTSNKETLLKNQVRRDATTNQLYNYSQIDFSVANNTETFSKVGTLNLNRVFFIVTGSTASASELTINNLRPYMNVQLIGGTTYGKPVGFFDININKYQMYIPEFETKNSAGQGGYYSGMTPGSADYPGKMANDDYTKDFGDVKEGLLQLTLNYINTGQYPNQTLQVQSLDAANPPADVFTRVMKNQFNGMVLTKHHLK